MTTYTSVFGGNTVKPADVSLTTLSLSANTTLNWPSSGQSPYTSAIIEVTPTAGSLTIKMPDARRAALGESVTFKNLGAYSFALQDSTGGSILSVGSGTTFTIYIRDNSTAAGLWGYWQAGAGSSTVDAAAIDGAGLDALAGLLRVSMLTNNYTSSQAFSDSNRGSMAVWTGGSGTFTVPSAASVGRGWYMNFKNAGSGTLTIASPASETFDGASSITLTSGQGVVVSCNGINFSYLSAGSVASAASFSYTSISIAGSGTYTLSAAEYAKKSIEFTGLLTGNRNVVVPTVAQDYWIINSTTGAFTVTVKTSAGTGIAVTQGKSATLFCDGTNVRAADTDYPAGLSTPISVANGGTGATTGSAAITNLGATTVGSQLFTAADAAAARSATSAAASGANTDISSVYLANTGLKIKDTNASHGLTIAPGSDITADRTLTLTTGDANRTLDISASNVTISAAGAALAGGADAAAQRTTLGLGSIATFNEGTAAEFRSNTSGKALSTDKVWSAADTVALTWVSAGTTAVDLGAGINFSVTTATGNSTLGAPTNAKTGQSGFIYITQDATTPRTLAFASAWKFDGGSAPSLTSTASAKDVLYYVVLNGTGPIIHASLRKDVK